MQMANAEEELAKGCYGYGSWKAPYWFIGPEQGQSAAEYDDLKLRFEAFRKLGKDGLCDCGIFHDFIRETRWHRARKPALQPTWRRLVLLLLTFLKQDSDNDSIRAYQRDQWGRLSGETCVIELSGLPARNLNVFRARDAFREKRIRFIRQKLLAFKPVFVVMYGMRAKKCWEEIAGIRLAVSKARKVNSIIVAFAAHPVSFGLKKKYWAVLGRRMRRLT